MTQRGRKSGAALAIAPVVRGVPRLGPPPALTDEQRGIWLETVNARPADWFGPEAIPLLESYCRHVVYGRQIAAEINRVEPEWLTTDEGLKRHKVLLEIHERETRAASSLATRLRLTNQALYDKKVAGRANDRHAAGSKPWETIEADED